MPMLLPEGGGPQKQEFSVRKQTAMGLWSCHGEQAARGACTDTHKQPGGLTLIRRRIVRRQGTPSPANSHRRLVVMP